MDKFLGNFRIVPELNNMDEFHQYHDAMKIPANVKEEMMKSMKTVKTSLTQEPDGRYKEVNDYGSRTEELFFKLDVPTVLEVMGMTTNNTFTLEGDHLKGVHEVGGQTTYTDRYWKDNKIVFDATGNGAKMTTYFEKI